MARPRLLDLFCGAGGAAVGYHRAGFEVVGVDIAPQPHYPFKFHQADAFEALMTEALRVLEFDAIHASPPCQAYSTVTRNFGSTRTHPDLLPPVRALLQATGLPWVIENVPGAPMRRDVVLCGCMFGLGVRRRRWFEFDRPTLALVPPCHHEGYAVQVCGHGPTQWYRDKIVDSADLRRKAMGIDWMTRDELSQAIPPAYTEWIGGQLAALVA